MIGTVRLDDSEIFKVTKHLMRALEAIEYNLREVDAGRIDIDALNEAMKQLGSMDFNNWDRLLAE